MGNEKPSHTFQLLYKNIVEEMFAYICENNINYCVQYKVNGDEIHVALWKKFEEYRSLALRNMSGNRLDRHKLASSICGALIETRPLVGYNGATIVKNANEVLGLYVGLNVIKLYMMYDFLSKKNIDEKEKCRLREYLKDNFDIQMPSLNSNICDTQEYRKNLENALHWSHHKCDNVGRECFCYDIWAYSTIFYHIESYNQPYLEAVYKQYIESQISKTQDV